MSNKTKVKAEETVVETEEIKEEEQLPSEEEIKSAKPEDKLSMMKKLLANQKVSEAEKQKKIYRAMGNIVVVRN